MLEISSLKYTNLVGDFNISVNDRTSRKKISKHIHILHKLIILPNII